jgi:hypothetical protein
VTTRPFEILETQDLLYALAEYTARYTRLLTAGGKQKDLVNDKETIRSLISEIELRRNPGLTSDPSSHKNR